MPITAIVPRTYTNVDSSVPRIVALGIVRPGSLILSEGMVADSSPINAHSVNVAVAVTAEKPDSPLMLKGWRWLARKYHRPSVAITIRGVSFRQVVSS